jgi:TolA-binding protein
MGKFFLNRMKYSMRHKTLFILAVLLFQSSFVFSQSLEETYASAMDDFSRGSYGASYQKFKSYIAAQSVATEKQAAAQFYAAECMNLLGDVESAIFEYEREITLYRFSNYREEALYKVGLLYFQIKSYSKCRDRLGILIFDYPNNEHYGSAQYWVGETFTVEEKYDDAIIFYQQAIQEKRNNKYLDYTIFSLAGIYEKKEDYKKAVEFYDMLLTYYKTSPLYASAQSRIGYCYYKLKDYENSIIELSNPAVESLSDEKKGEALYMLGNSYFRTAEYDKAQATFEDIVKKYPAIPFIREINYSLAWCHFQKSEFNDAYKTFHSLVDGSDSLARLSLYWEGESQRYLGNDNEALKSFDDFLKRYPSYPMTYGAQYQMGVIHYGRKMYEKAAYFLENALSTRDIDLKGKIYVLLGEVELNRSVYQKSYQYFSDAKSLNHLQDDLKNRAEFGIGATAYCMKNYDEAIKVLSALSERTKNFETDKVSFYLAESFFQSERYHEALNYYKKVDINNPELGSAVMYGTAYCYYNQKDYASASFSYLDFIKKYPKDIKVYDARLRLADTYLAGKKYSDASKIYEDLLKSKSVEKNKDYLSYQFGLSLYKAGKVQNALDEFNRLVTTYPRSSYAENSIYMMGWISFQQGKLQEAIETYRRMLAYAPDSKIAPLVYYSLGDAYYNSAKYDTAITCYATVINNYPNSNYVYDAINGIQTSYMAKGDVDAAVNTIDTYVKQRKSAGYADQLFLKKGELYYSQGNYMAARSAYSEFIFVFPKSKNISKAYYWIGKCELLLGNADEALKKFKLVFDSYPSTDEAVSAVIEWGQELRNQRAYDAAIKVYEEAYNKIQTPQSRAEFLYWKAVTLNDKGDVASAYDVYDEVVQYYDGSIFADKARLDLGNVEMNSKRYSNAVKYFQNLSTKRTDDLGAAAQYNLGVLYQAQSKSNEAITAFVRVLNSFSQHDEWATKANLRLGDIYSKMKDNRRAKEMYKAVLDKHPDDDYGKEAQQKMRRLK